jgi:hypothetical protein
MPFQLMLVSGVRVEGVLLPDHCACDSADLQERWFLFPDPATHQTTSMGESG